MERFKDQWKGLAMAVLVCAAAQISQAQAPTLIDPVDIVEGLPTDEILVAEWFVTNATENPMTLTVSRNVLQTVETMNLPYEVGAPGAYERFCWGGTCYQYGTAESALSLALTLQPSDTTGLNAFGAEDWLIADYYPNGEVGATAIEYCFEPTQQGVSTVCHTVVFCTGIETENCVLSVEENAIELQGLAPNPVVGVSSLTYRAPDGGVLRFLDLTGRTVKSVVLAPGQGAVWVDGADFAPGIYLYALEVNGRIGQARKFNVAR